MDEDFCTALHRSFDLIWITFRFDLDFFWTLDYDKTSAVGSFLIYFTILLAIWDTYTPVFRELEICDSEFVRLCVYLFDSRRHRLNDR